MANDKDKPVMLTPDQLKRFRELGLGETDEEFDLRLQKEQARLAAFENSDFIPSNKPSDVTMYNRVSIKFNYDDIIKWFKGWFK